MTNYTKAMNRRSRIFGIVFFVAILIFGASCTGQEQDSGSQSQNDEPIKIGAIVPVTGNLAWFGENARNAAQLLEEDLSEKGKQVDINIYDSKSTPKGGLNAYRKLISDGVKYAYVTADPIAKPIIPKLSQDQALIFAGSVDNDIAGMSNSVFRLYYGFEEQIETQYDFITTQSVEDVSMLLRDVSHNRKYYDTLGNQLGDRGIEVASVETFGGSTRDFRNILTKLLQERPDMIIMSEYGELYPTIFEQLRTLSSDTPQVLAGLGMMNVRPDDYSLYEGVVFTAPAYTTSGETSFETTYTNRFGSPPSYEAYYAYDSLRLLYSSIKNTDGDIQSVRKHLKSNTFQGVSQPKINLDKSGDLETQTTLKTFRDGQVVRFEEPAETAAGKGTSQDQLESAHGGKELFSDNS